MTPSLPPSNPAADTRALSETFIPSAEMVERVARAICESDGIFKADATNLNSPNGKQWALCITAAAAALSIAIPLIAEKAAKMLDERASLARSRRNKLSQADSMLRASIESQISEAECCAAAIRQDCSIQSGETK